MRGYVVFALFALVACTLADDPAGSWLSYARYDAAASSTITALNTSWTVPAQPETPFGSNAPGWWFGVMDKDGNGALVQPILAYGYTGNHYSIFNACFDWTDGSWHTSDETYTVQSGDKITSSVTYNADANSYTMLITSEQLGKTVKMDYALEKRQTETESSAVFVLEHQPRNCDAYPTDGSMSFDDIYVEVDGKAVANPQWQALQEQPACDSKAIVKDSKTIQFTWNPSKTAATAGLNAGAPLKWGANATQA
eukprot:g3109.t1